MTHTERYTGFIIERSHITVVEVAHNPKGYTLTGAGSFDSEIDFDAPEIFEELGMDKRAKTFASEMQDYLKKSGNGSKYFSFGLNSRMVMLQKIPIEMSLTDEEFNLHLEWELKNYFQDAVIENYVVLPFALVDSNGEPGNNAMVIAVRKSFANFLSNVSKRCHGSSHVIDIDQFCAETSIIHNFPEVKNSPSAVFGIDEETVDCSFLVGGKNSDIQIQEWNGNRDIQNLVSFAEINNAKQIYLHGRIVTEEFAEQLRQHTTLPVILSDPFKKISLPKSMKNLEMIQSQRQEYTAALGLALRTE